VELDQRTRDTTMFTTNSHNGSHALRSLATQKEQPEQEDILLLSVTMRRLKIFFKLL